MCLSKNKKNIFFQLRIIILQPLQIDAFLTYRACLRNMRYATVSSHMVLCMFEIKNQKPNFCHKAIGNINFI